MHVDRDGAVAAASGNVRVGPVVVVLRGGRETVEKGGPDAAGREALAVGFVVDFELRVREIADPA